MNKQEINTNLLAQVVHIYNDRQHGGHAKAKTRAEVNRTTRKVYKQKHTGNARHGSKRAPIFVGGGVTHGPKGIKRVLSMPTVMKKVALSHALALKDSEKMITMVDFTGVKKTRDAVALLPVAKRYLVVIQDENKSAFRAVRNIATVTPVYARDLNAQLVLLNGHIVFDEPKKAATEKKTVKIAKKETKKN